MAQKNLDKMSLKELTALKADVEKAIANFEKRKRTDALKEMEAVAKKHGLTIADVLGDKSKKKSAKAKAAAKYSNPSDASQTWSGRGRQPAWFKEALASGKSPEDLAI